MSRIGTAPVAALAFGLLLGFSTLAAAGFDFPPISDADKALTSVPFAPDAPAVVIERTGYFWMLDPDRHQISSRLSVRVRMKILKPEGRKWGEVTIAHSSQVRFDSFEGRTVSPDGTVTPVPKNAIFERETSHDRKTYETAVAFPLVEPGAILDYAYDLWFDSIFYLEPWSFQLRLPVVSSDITFEIPKTIGAKTWRQETTERALQTTQDAGVVSTKMKISGSNFPPIPDEPFSVADENMSTRMLLVPTMYSGRGGQEKLLSDWETACGFLKRAYDDFVTQAGSARKWARQAVDALPEADRKNKRKIAETLYRFVRDELANVDDDWVGVRGKFADKIFDERKGTPAQKALLLQTMLHRVDVASVPVWASDLRRGQPSLAVPTPTWFDRVLLKIDLGGETAWADPSDSALPFGRLSPWVEGSSAVVVDFKAPQEMTLPVSPIDASVRSTKIELEAAANGRIRGKGSIRLSGHWDWLCSNWNEAKWKEKLGADLPGYELLVSKRERRSDTGETTVEFELTQDEKAALGDEAAVRLSAPIGPRKQPFTATSSARKSPLRLPFLQRDEVETTIRWPKGWSTESRPEPIRIENEVGLLATAITDLPDAAGLTWSCRFEERMRDYDGSQTYGRLRNLHEKLEKVDTARLSLVRR